MIFLEQYFWENHVLTRTPPPYTEDGDLVLESVRRHTGSADQDAPVVTLDLSLTAKLMRYLQLQEQKKLTEAGSKEIGGYEAAEGGAGCGNGQELQGRLPTGWGELYCHLQSSENARH